jgi:hypothetical protein
MAAKEAYRLRLSERDGMVKAIQRNLMIVFGGIFGSGIKYEIIPNQRTPVTANVEGI